MARSDSTDASQVAPRHASNRHKSRKSIKAANSISERRALLSVPKQSPTGALTFEVQCAVALTGGEREGGRV